MISTFVCGSVSVERVYKYARSDAGVLTSPKMRGSSCRCLPGWTGAAQDGTAGGRKKAVYAMPGGIFTKDTSTNLSFYLVWASIVAQPTEMS